MITLEQQKQGVELHNALVQKAWESAAFKEQLIKNPVETIESETGHKMKNDTKVVVEDQTDDSFIYLNIPVKPNLEEFELTEQQLEEISGGIAVLTGITLFAAGIAIGGAAKKIYNKIKS